MKKLKYLFMVVLVAMLLPSTDAKADCTITVDGKKFTEGEVYESESAREQDWSVLNPKLQNYAGWFQCDKKASPTASAVWYTKGYVPTASPLTSYTLPNKSGSNYVEWRWNEGQELIGKVTKKSTGNSKLGFKDTLAGKGSASATHGSGTNKTHTFFAYNYEFLRDWADTSKIKANSNGERTIYLQPIIGVKDRKNGKYEATGTDYRSLADWKKAKGWSNPSTFMKHYNLPVKFTATAGVNVKYCMYNNEKKTLRDSGRAEISIAGKTYDLTSKELKDVEDGHDLSMQKTIDAKVGDESVPKELQGKHFVLVGVRITSKNKLGTEGSFVLNLKSTENTVKSGNYNANSKQKTLYKDDNKNKVNTNGKFALKVDSSGVYDRLSKSTFQLYNDATITYLYAEVQDYTDVYVKRLYYRGGVDSDEDNLAYIKDPVNPSDKGYLIGHVKNGETETFTLDEKVQRLDKKTFKPVKDKDGNKKYLNCGAYNEIDKSRAGTKGKAIWQLTQIELDNSTCATIGKTVRKKENKTQVSGTPRGLGTNKWEDKMEDNAVTVKANGGTVTIYLTYRLYVPQMKLTYYLDGTGKYNLLKQQAITSVNSKKADGTKNISDESSVDSFKPSVWGSDQTVTVDWNRRITTDIDNDKGDETLYLVRTRTQRATVATKAIKEYGKKRRDENSAGYNMWRRTGDTLTDCFKQDVKGVDPTNGTANIYVKTNAAFASAKRDAVKNSMVQSLKVTTKQTAQPAAYVGVYREMPSVTVVTMLRTKRGGKTVYYQIDDDVKKVFNDGTGTVKCERTHTYPVTAKAKAPTFRYDMLFKQDGVMTTMSKTQLYTEYYRDESGKEHKVKVRPAQVGTIEDSGQSSAAQTKKHVNDLLALLQSHQGKAISEADVKSLDVAFKTDFKSSETLKNGVYNKVALIKIVEDAGSGYWKASYADIEDGGKVGDGKLSNYTKTFKREGSAEFTRFKDKAELKEAVPSFESGLSYDRKNGDEDYSLTNLGITVDPKDGATLSAGFADETMETWPAGTQWLIDTSKTWSEVAGSEGLQEDGTLSANAMDALLKGVHAWDTDSNYFKDGTTSTLLYGVYKPVKTLHVGTVYRQEDGTYRVLEDYDDRKLNIYTTDYTPYFAPYTSSDGGEALKLEEFKLLAWGGTDARTLDEDAKSFKGWDRVEPTWSGSDGEAQTVCAKDIRINGEQTYLVAVYEREEPGTGTYEPEESESYRAQIATDGFKEGSGSWYDEVLTNDIAVDGEGIIAGDEEYNEGQKYDVSAAIPSGEYVKTSASAPKYLVNVQYKGKGYIDRFTINHLGYFGTSYTKTDAYGNSVTVYYGARRQSKSTVEKECMLWTMDSYAVYTPEDVTVRNAILPAGDLNQQVTMFRNGEIFEKGLPSFTFEGLGGTSMNMGATGEWQKHLENHTTPGVFDGYANDVVDDSEADGAVKAKELLAELIAEWDATDTYDVDCASTPTRVAKNQTIKFNNGDGKTITLLDSSMAEPQEIPNAPSIGAKAFSSKNDNQKDMAVKGGTVTQADTTVLQINSAMKDLVYLSTGGIHYKRVSAFTSHEGKEAWPEDLAGRIEVNNATVLTPVVIDFSVSDENGWNQKVGSSIGDPLVLDRPFSVTVTAKGQHSELPGYGERDYSKYLGKRKYADVLGIYDGEEVPLVDDIQIKFPFETVYVHKGTDGEVGYIGVPANAWFTIPFYFLVYF